MKCIPRLIDEWQVEPIIGDDVRISVDKRGTQTFTS